MLCLAFIFGLFSSALDPATSKTSSEPLVEERERAYPTLLFPKKGARVFLIADLLYWSAQEKGINFGYQAEGIPNTLPLSNVKAVQCDTHYKPGFRIGVGYRLPHDLWEIAGYVTQLRTTNDLYKRAKNGSFLTPNLGITNGYAEEQGSWHLKYTLFDLALARTYAAAKSLAIKPFFGLRGAWIQENTQTTFSDPQVFEMTGKNHFKAGGIHIGSNLHFFLADYLCFFAHAGASLLSGQLDIEMDVKMDNAKLFSGKGKPDRLCANCEMQAGMQGTIPLYRKQAYLTLGISYEMSLWFSQNQLFNFFNTSSAIQIEAQETDLMLQGVTFSTRLDF